MLKESEIQELLKTELMPSEEELEREEAESLEHHGIKGMKWGVKHGPPYPLEEKISKRVSNTSGKLKKKKSKLHLTDEQKRAVAIGATAVGVGLAIYGGYKLGALNKLTKIGNLYDPMTGLKKKIKSMSRLQDLKLVNPDYPGKGTTMNCFNCVTANELRARGFDVQALKRTIGVDFNDFKKLFKNFDPKTALTEKMSGESDDDYRARCIEALEKKLKNNGVGARGVIAGYRVGADSSLTGHVFSWEVMSDGVHYFDAQRSDEDADSYLKTVFIPNMYKYGRLDDLEIIPRYLKKHVKNR